MKTRNSLGSFGSFVALLASLSLLSNSHAQDQQKGAPQALTAALGTQPLTALSPDGAFYAVATPDGRIRYGGTEDGAAVHIFHLCQPRTVIFSPDGHLLAAAGGGGSDCHPARLKVWQVSDGRLLCKVESGMGRNPALSFSPDSTLLASTAAGVNINVWQLPKGTLQGSFTPKCLPSHLAFSKECKVLIALGTDGSVQHFPMP